MSEFKIDQLYAWKMEIEWYKWLNWKCACPGEENLKSSRKRKIDLDPVHIKTFGWGPLPPPPLVVFFMNLATKKINILLFIS